MNQSLIRPNEASRALGAERLVSELLTSGVPVPEPNAGLQQAWKGRSRQLPPLYFTSNRGGRNYSCGGKRREEQVYMLTLKYVVNKTGGERIKEDIY